MPRKSKLQIKVIRLKRKINFFLKYKKKYILLIFLFFIFIFWINAFYNKYVNNPENIVSNIYFDKEIINNDNLNILIKNSINTFSWTNTAKNKLLKYKTEKKYILNKYPFLEKINLEVLNKNSLKISYSFKKPKLLMIWSWNIFAIYWKSNYIQKYDKNNLSWLNLDVKEKINLPSYIDTSNNLKWIFWKNSSNKLIKYIQKIKEFFPNWVLFYIVWWENIKVINNWKTIYFSLKKSIDKQISQLDLIKNKKPKLYSWAIEIDIGNLDEWIYFKTN